MSLKVLPDQEIKKGDLRLHLRVQGQEVRRRHSSKKSSPPRTVQASTNGKVLSVGVKEGDALKKGKTKILVMDHEKGTLP